MNGSTTEAPKFTKPLKDFACAPGQCCVLECRVKGSPEKIVWTREGAEIEDSFEFRTLHRGEVCTLVIGELFPEDAGTFTCEAINSSGSAKTSCCLSVQGNFNNISSVSTNESAYHPPKPKSPSLNHQNTVSSPRHHIAPSTVVMTTKQTPRNHDDTHNFKREKDQLIQDVARAVTTPKPLQPQYRKVQRPEIALIEQDIKKRMQISSSHEDSSIDPTSATQFSKKAPKKIGQEYKVSSFEQRLINEIEYRLEQSPPVVEDPEDDVFEDVETGAEKLPFFVVPLKNYHVTVGTGASLICQVNGQPKAKVFWFKDGKQISKRSRHYLTSCDKDGVCELRIPELYAEDDGNYTALATNPLGRVSSTARIAVSSHRIMNPDMVADGMIRAPKTPEKGILAEDEESAVEKYYRPVFVQKPPETVLAEEGKLVRFNVKVTGLPLPDISFSINGMAVRSDATHRILVRESNVHSLLFEQVSMMDEGTYVITAKNRAGSNTIRVNLKVKAREYSTPPTFVQRPVATCAAEGDAVRLEARVLATPRPVVTWKKGSDQIMHSHRTQLYQDDTGYVCLQISQADLNDTAWYTCSAVNKAGIASCNCKLDIYCPRPEVKSTQMRRIRTPNRYANLARVAGVDMKESLVIDGRFDGLPESEDL